MPPAGYGMRMQHVNFHWSYWDKFENTREHQRQVWEHRQQPCQHLGAPATSLDAPRITVKQSGKNNIFGNGAGVPGNSSYYLLFKDCSNSGIQFVFTSMYLYSYPSTHSISGLAAGGPWEQFEVRPRWQLRELRDTFRGHDGANFEMQSEGVIEHVGDRFACHDRMNLAMHSEITLKGVYRRTSSLWSCKLQSHHRASLEMHLGAMIVRTCSP